MVAFLLFLKEENKMRCSICGQEIIGDEHNAMPVTNDICCESCNDNVVIPIRLYNLGTNQKEGLFLGPDYKVKFLKPEGNKFTLKELQSKVEGYIEYYPTSNKKYKIIVNEEGLLMRLPLNKFASSFFGIHAVGNVLIIPNKLLE
jgi:DNA-directed RNA polymerase subunit RPC12/RpoP